MAEEITTIEEALAAVRNTGFAMSYVPDELKTAELCNAAMENDAMCICYVPEKHQTDRMISLFIEALKKKKESGGTDYFEECLTGFLLSVIAGQFRKTVEEKMIEILGFGGGDFDYWMNWGTKMLNDGNYRIAIEAFSVAITLFGSGEFYAARGRAYRLNGEDGRAEADFTKARELGWDGGNIPKEQGARSKE